MASEHLNHASASLWQDPPIQAFIFDMDGVLIDSEPIYFEIEKSSFQHLGATVEETEHHTYVGVTLESMFQQVLNKHQLDHVLAEVLEFHKENVMKVMQGHEELQAFDHVEQWIQWLSNSGIKLAVASSSPRSLIELILERTGLRPFFTVMVSGEEVAHGKPAPDIFLHAAELLQVDPQHCVVIEDSRNGVQAAKDAGMRCIGHQNPGSGNQDLSKADIIIHSYAELLELRDSLHIGVRS